MSIKRCPNRIQCDTMAAQRTLDHRLLASFWRQVERLALLARRSSSTVASYAALQVDRHEGRPHLRTVRR